MTRAGMKIRRALRLVGWNALFLVLGLALIGVAGETYWRLRAPFGETFRPYAWSPNVGAIYKPHADVRWTNHLDFWTESRTNGLGFVDREPIGLERAAASCHVAMIGDSYVEALQVPGEPAARSVFDIHIGENMVTYLKSPCSAADVQAEFFLHVVPEDLENLPADRRQYGFGGMNFHYGEHAALDFGGRCIMKHPLPDYPIARIRTGQFTPEGDRIWMAEFPVGAAEGAPSP